MQLCRAAQGCNFSVLANRAGCATVWRVTKVISRLFLSAYAVISLLFFVCALALIVFAIAELWRGVNITSDASLRDRFNAVLEGIGLLTIAVAALELGQTILEEEVQRETQLSAPTRVRRFLSRFMIVIIVSLSIESLVAVFQFIHDEPANLTQAGVIILATAALLAAWGVFVKLNRSAEEIEPEAMARTKREDEEIEKAS
jgi:hypothetical protein